MQLHLSEPPPRAHALLLVQGTATGEQQELLGLGLNSTSHEMRDSKKSTEREKAEASETIKALASCVRLSGGKKVKKRPYSPQQESRETSVLLLLTVLLH